MNDIENNKKEKKHVISGCVKFIPRAIKYVIIIGILVGAFGLGRVFPSTVVTQAKSTKLGLEDVGELVTQTCYVTTVIDNKTSKKLFDFEVPFTTSRQIFSYDSEVDASVDFSKITYSINEDKKQIKIKIPHADIYKVTPKYDSLKVYLDSESLFSRINVTQFNDSMKDLQNQATIDAKANGVLDAADENAKNLVESFIKSNDDFKDYTPVYEYI